MSIARTYLRIALVASVIFGGAYLIVPAQISEMMGIQHATPAGLTDLRATYAGFQLGMAALLGWCLRDHSRYAAGLVAFACVVGALALSRLLGLWIDGFSIQMLIAALVEIAIASFAVYSLALLGSERS